MRRAQTLAAIIVDHFFMIGFLENKNMNGCENMHKFKRLGFKRFMIPGFRLALVIKQSLYDLNPPTLL